MASIVGEMKEVPLFKLGELDAEAMRFLYELGTKNRSYTVQEIDGRMYVNTNDLVRIKEPFPAVLPTVNIFTLSGLVDYILNDPDGQLDKFGNLVVQVTDPRKVVLYGIKCSDDYAVRAELESFAPPTPVKQSVFFDQTDDGTIYATQKLNQVAGQLDMAGNVQPEAVSMPIGTTEDEPQDEQGTMPQIVSFRAKERSL